MIDWELLQPGLTFTDLGYLPEFVSVDDPRDARAQLDAGYHVGGFRPMQGFWLDADDRLHYPGDPPLAPLAQARLRHERIVLYPYAWVAVIQRDRSFVVARMD